MLGYLVTSGVRIDKDIDRGAQSDEPFPGHGLDAPYPSRSRPASRQPTRNVLHGYAREAECYSEWSTVMTTLPIFCPVSTYR
jgi:hypothetical protein